MDQPHRAKKSLGQNFLKDKKTLDAIIEATQLGMPVLEVGPGKGALTKRLLEAGHRVIAIEKDHRLIEPLREMFTDEISSGQFTLLEGDALEEGPEKILGPLRSQFQIVANLPYYITGLYLRKTLESMYQPQQIILLLQKEVVDRIVARDGRESILSISVKCFGTPRKLCNVHKKHFSPQPKIDSAVLQITDISQDLFTQKGIAVKGFFAVVKQGFSSKRKTLANNLKPLLVQHNKQWSQVAHELGLGEKIRPEEVTTEQWAVLTELVGGVRG